MFEVFNEKFIYIAFNGLNTACGLRLFVSKE